MHHTTFYVVVLVSYFCGGVKGGGVLHKKILQFLKRHFLLRCLILLFLQLLLDRFFCRISHVLDTSLMVFLFNFENSNFRCLLWNLSSVCFSNIITNYLGSWRWGTISSRPYTKYKLRPILMQIAFKEILDSLAYIFFYQ